MIKVLSSGKKVPKPTRVTCKRCESELLVEHHEWWKGVYGSELVVLCPCCHEEVVRPGTEYWGDF